MEAEAWLTRCSWFSAGRSAGKPTFYDRVSAPSTHLELVNADRIAAQRWPGQEAEHAYDAARSAGEERTHRMAARTSFVTETVFSHESKMELVREAHGAGYHTSLYVITAYVYDNTVAATPFRLVASFLDRGLLGELRWPAWTPVERRDE